MTDQADMVCPDRELNGAEALMGFLNWLMIRPEPVTFSATHDASLAVVLFNHFTAVNPVGTLGPDWPDCVTPVQACPVTNNLYESFETQLTRLLNRHSLENGSDTPDFILAQYLTQCLAVFNHTLVERETWYGRTLGSGRALPALQPDGGPSCA
jgi:hypothetical protein